MTMIYQEIDQKETRARKVAEVRMNLRRVHNFYVDEKDFSEKESSLDLFKFCDTKNQVYLLKTFLYHQITHSFLFFSL